MFSIFFQLYSRLVHTQTMAALNNFGICGQKHASLWPN
jgi:hypothetical protein